MRIASTFGVLVSALTVACTQSVTPAEIDAGSMLPDAGLDALPNDVALRPDVAMPDVVREDRVVPPDVSVDVPVAPTACMPGTWCWENPLPQGNPLRRALLLDVNEAYAVGEAGTILRRSGGTWQTEWSDPAVSFTGLWGTLGTDLWAWGMHRVGLNPDRSVLLQRTERGWQEVAVGTLPFVQELRGSDARNVWLLRYGGANEAKEWLRWDGVSWSPVPALPENAQPSSFCVRSARDAWATASRTGNSFPTLLFHWNGSTWTRLHETQSSERFEAPVACPADSIALSGTLHFNTGIYYGIEVRGSQVQRTRTVSALSSIYRTTPHGELYSVGNDLVRRWTPAGWEEAFSVSPRGRYATDGFDFTLDHSHAVLPTESAVVLPWAGLDFPWAQEPVRTDLSVVLRHEGELLAAMGDGRIVDLRTQPLRELAVETLPNGQAFRPRDAWAESAQAAWLVGAEGMLVRTNGARLEPVASPTQQTLVAVHGASPEAVWAVGANGAVLRLVQGRWELAPALPEMAQNTRLPDLELTAVDVRANNDVYVLGNDVAGGAFASVLFHWNGMLWTVAYFQFGTTLEAMLRTPAGTVFLRNGDTMLQQAPGEAMWRRGPSAPGGSGRLRLSADGELEQLGFQDSSPTLYRYHEAEEHWEPLGTGAVLPSTVSRTLVSDRHGALWAFGANTSVLRYQP